MASVFVKRGRYYANWKNAAGRWVRSVTKCTTKRDAQRYADDLEQKAERQRMGLEPLPTARPDMTFGDLFEWWWTQYGSKLRGDNGGFYRKRLEPVFRFPLQELTPARIEDLLQGYADGLAPKSLNGLRGAIHTIFSKALRRGRWAGLNPAVAVERRKVSRKIYESLRAEEVPPLLAMLSPEWRPLFACAIWTALRKGELLGLEKSDIDLKLGTITVRRSYDRDTTKGGHADVIPIAEPLIPFLVQALASSRSKYVFPAANGSMRSDETDLQQVLRRAMNRAELVRGWEHVCRRKTCGHREQSEDSSLRRWRT